MRDDDASTASSPTKRTIRYAFGESAIKRMVRILHSTVMVRVGGGWEELASFLGKHDPCRARGRTNLELYQNSPFLAAAATPTGARDEMAAFSRKSSASTGADAAAERQRQNAEIIELYKQGPIMKVGEQATGKRPSAHGAFAGSREDRALDSDVQAARLESIDGVDTQRERDARLFAAIERR